MDRREFMKLTAAGTAAIAIPGCGRDARPRTAAPATFDGSIAEANPAAPATYDGSIAEANPAAPATYDGAGADRKPNVLFIFDDQLRADVCGVYGGNNITTPNIDRLAGQGVVFANSVSSCPLCTPYRGMLQTGRYPTHSGLIMNFVEANAGQNPHCLADVFAAAGYATGFIGKWHLSSGWRHEEGLYNSNQAAVDAYQAKNPETEYVPPGPGRLGYQHWQAYNFHTSFNNYFHYEDEAKKIYSDRYETDTQIDQAIAYMEKCRASGQTFFLSVAPHPPHPPFDPGFIPAGYLEQTPETIQWSPNVPTANNPRTVMEMRYYLAMAKNMDDNLGRLMAYLETSGLAADTIVVFTADHGEMHGSHGRVNKMVPYAEAMNLPLIVRWPKRIVAGSRTDALQTPMDHLPTLCGLAGLGIPKEVDGTDLSQAILGKGGGNSGDGREDVLIGSYTSNWDFLQTGTDWPEWRGVKTKQYTYCKWLAGSEELYDNLADPYQLKNLAADGTEPEVLGRLRARMKDLLAAAHDDFRPGTGYGEWYDNQRNLIRTGLGPVGV
jgi:arylsulfatase A-like enzyme